MQTLWGICGRAITAVCCVQLACQRVQLSSRIHQAGFLRGASDLCSPAPAAVAATGRECEEAAL